RADGRNRSGLDALLQPRPESGVSDGLRRRLAPPLQRGETLRPGRRLQRTVRFGVDRGRRSAPLSRPPRLKRESVRKCRRTLSLFRAVGFRGSRWKHAQGAAAGAEKMLKARSSGIEKEAAGDARAAS